MTRILLIVDYIPLRTMLGFFSIRRRFFNNFFLNNKKSKNRKILKNIFSYSFLFFQFQWIFSLLTIPKNQGKKFPKMKLLNFFSSRGMFLFSEIFLKFIFSTLNDQSDTSTFWDRLFILKLNHQSSLQICID